MFRFNPRSTDDIFSEFFGYSSPFRGMGDMGGCGGGSAFSRSVLLEPWVPVLYDFWIQWLQPLSSTDSRVQDFILPGGFWNVKKLLGVLNIRFSGSFSVKSAYKFAVLARIPTSRSAWLSSSAGLRSISEGIDGV
ncbi:hypothetical protein NE237_000345 [Protea cynaroides]|uniref:Uncharacterized protein n=1 Tax=Protea cynaroides TaxID=273540 RepID=A0A9Q0QXE2_9MAGN|nr:hypothetical protein NE237_000345 [Protea cynaroides]